MNFPATSTPQGQLSAPSGNWLWEKVTPKDVAWYMAQIELAKKDLADIVARGNLLAIHPTSTYEPNKPFKFELDEGWHSGFAKYLWSINDCRLRAYRDAGFGFHLPALDACPPWIGVSK